MSHRKRLSCSVDCWHYSVFGGVEGCGKKNGSYGGWPEQIKLGERCLYPSERDVGRPGMVVSLFGVCVALEGAVIQGGPHDNTKFVRMLKNTRNTG